MSEAAIEALDATAASRSMISIVRILELLNERAAIVEQIGHIKQIGRYAHLRTQARGSGFPQRDRE